MKHITRVVITHVEVEDDYKPPGIVETDKRVELELTGDLFVSFEYKDKWGFVSMDENFEEFSTIRKFLFWSNIQWYAFYGKPDLPSSIQAWMEQFREDKMAPTQWALEVGRERKRRLLEVTTRQINMKHWNEHIFNKNTKYFSLN